MLFLGFKISYHNSILDSKSLYFDNSSSIKLLIYNFILISSENQFINSINLQNLSLSILFSTSICLFIDSYFLWSTVIVVHIYYCYKINQLHIPISLYSNQNVIPII